MHNDLPSPLFTVDLQCQHRVTMTPHGADMKYHDEDSIHKFHIEF